MAQPAPAPADDAAYGRAMLPKVSRTFALCIRLLPPRLEHPVRTAYLLCRIADTVEDAVGLAVAEKHRLLAAFQTDLADAHGGGEALAAAFPHPTGDDERLTADAGIVLRDFQALPAPERDAIRPWVQEMCQGMTSFARAARGPAGSGLQALSTLEDLDRYCYYVAGTVGHLLTELFQLHLGRPNPDRDARLKELATSFGLGLQLTNIIKDVVEDHSRGWSFVPLELCREAGIAPEQLFAPGYEAASRQVLVRLILKARTHLDDALAYSLTLPRSAYRIRLFCLTSLLFAARTLGLARRRPLAAHEKLKISRAEVYRTVAAAAVLAPSNGLLRAYYRRLLGPPPRGA